MAAAPKSGPLIAAGLVLGTGLGGFVDGIVLHQILQWHNMLSAKLPPDTLIRAKVNMVWDGYFHAGVWLMTALGVGLLWRATGREDVPRSGRTLAGSLLAGWGLFNLVEGVIDHHLLKLHHVMEYVPENVQSVWDFGFLGLSVALLFGGWMLVRTEKARRGLDRSPRHWPPA